VLMVAAERLTQGDRHATFLCRRTGDEAADGPARVTMLACPPDLPRHLAAVVAVSPAGDLHGLTGPELVILGLLVEDWSDQRVAAALGLPLVAVTERVEQVLAGIQRLDDRMGPGCGRAAARAFHRWTHGVPRRRHSPQPPGVCRTTGLIMTTCGSTTLVV